MKQLFNILITSEQFLPTRSGMATVVSELALALSALGHSITIATSKHSERKKSDYPHLKIQEFDIRGGFGNFYRGEIDAYISFVLTSNFDIIINECVQTWNTDLLFPHLSKIKGIKLLHSHGFSLYKYRLQNPWANIKAFFYYRTLIHYLNRYDKVLILSSLGSEIPYFEYYNFNNYEILPNGVPTQLIAQQYKTRCGYPILLSISNFFPLKKQEFILKAFYLSHSTATLIFIGTLQLHHYLTRLKILKRRLDIKYGSKEVYFYDSLSREETLNHLSQATLFLHGSKLEAFPIVILEAMATGTPWISTDVGNVKELVGGLVIEREKDMALAIDQLLSDSAYYSKLSSDALDAIKSHYTWPQIATYLESIVIKINKSTSL